MSGPTLESFYFANLQDGSSSPIEWTHEFGDRTRQSD